MGSKVIVYLGLFLAIVLIYSEVAAARELTDTSSRTEVAGKELTHTSNTVDTSKEAKKTDQYGPITYGPVTVPCYGC